MAYPRGMPPGGKPGGSERINPFSPSLPTRFIIFDISRYCLSSLLMSCTEVPEPLAMRCLREAWMIFGLRHAASSFSTE